MYIHNKIKIQILFSPLENIRVALYMEQENIRRAKELGFQGIFTANSNRLTQLISRALKYEVMSIFFIDFCFKLCKRHARF